MLMIQTLPEFRLVAGMASKTPATQAAHYIPATNTQPVQPARRTLWGWVTGFVAALSGLAPHVLHHVGLLAGVALVAGTKGTILFGLIGFLVSIPFLLRLRRRLGTWRAPAIGLVIFAVMFSLSAFVIGPAISGQSGTSNQTPTQQVDHSSHHG
jgi:hypothetical protein